MAVRRNEWHAVIFDGLHKDSIIKAGKEALPRLAEAVESVEPNLENINFSRGLNAVPQQPDQWSCGHRLVLHLDALLRMGLAMRRSQDECWVKPMSELVVQKKHVSDEKLVALCESSGGSVPSPPRVKQEQNLAFQTQPQPSRAAMQAVASPMHKLKSELPSRSRPVRIQEQAAPQVAAEQAASQVAAQQTAPQVAATDPKPEQSPGLPQANLAPAAASRAEAFDAHLAATLAAPEREIARMTRKEEALAKRILTHAGLSFNDHFQKAHAEKLEKNHWQKIPAGSELQFAYGFTAGFGVCSLPAAASEVLHSISTRGCA